MEQSHLGHRKYESKLRAEIFPFSKYEKRNHIAPDTISWWYTLHAQASSIFSFLDSMNDFACFCWNKILATYLFFFNKAIVLIFLRNYVTRSTSPRCPRRRCRRRRKCPNSLSTPCRLRRTSPIFRESCCRPSLLLWVSFQHVILVNKDKLSKITYKNPL